MGTMSLAQGVELTLMGVSVVFAGLILTFLMINLFSTLPKMLRFLRKRKGEKTEKKPGAGSPISEDHLAVIATVLDVEFKMRSLMDKGRFTFK